MSKFMDIACECGHGSTEHVENRVLPFGYQCTRCACILLMSRPGAPLVEVDNDPAAPDEVALIESLHDEDRQ